MSRSIYTLSQDLLRLVLYTGKVFIISTTIFFLTQFILSALFVPCSLRSSANVLLHSYLSCNTFMKDKIVSGSL